MNAIIFYLFMVLYENRPVLELNNRMEKLSIKLLEAESTKKTLQDENKRLDKQLTAKLNENLKFNSLIVQLETEINELKEQSKALEKENIDKNVIINSLQKSNKLVSEPGSICIQCEQYKLIIANNDATIS